MKVNKYIIGRWLRNLKWDHRNLYNALTALIVMLCVCYALTLFSLPIVLAHVFDSGWYLLLIFIGIPTIIGTIGWICDCFDY